MRGGLAIFAVDPGKTTGVAWGVFDRKKTTGETLSAGRVMGSAQIQGETPLESAAAVCRLWQEFWLHESKVIAPPVMVIEDFILRPGRATADRDMLTPVQITGMIQGWFERDGNGPEFVLQQPAEAKGFATNERLKRWGVDTWGGGRHAKDAWRHIAVYLAKQSNLTNQKRKK